eukprot:UN16000
MRNFQAYVISFEIIEFLSFIACIIWCIWLYELYIFHYFLDIIIPIFILMFVPFVILYVFYNMLYRCISRPFLGYFQTRHTIITFILILSQFLIISMRLLLP